MDTNQEKNAFEEPGLPAEVEIIGISFGGSGKIYYFAANGHTASIGMHAIVETARGLEYGDVSLGNTFVKRETIVLPLKNVVRIADRNDDLRFESNKEKEKEALEICQKKIAEHKLDMKLVDAEYTFDNSKLLFYFTADDRVDFRELVKDLAGYFRTRIELRQIGIRDEAKMMGGLGICGRPFCCATFLPDFVQVSIKMAKEQNLSLNAAKISGACGRLMCCLRYEYDTYQEEMRKLPKIDSTVMTPDGVGVVTELKPLEGGVKVMLSDGSEKSPKLYEVSLLRPYDKNAPTVEEADEEPKTAMTAGTDGRRARTGRSVSSGAESAPAPAGREKPDREGRGNKEEKDKRQAPEADADPSAALAKQTESAEELPPVTEADNEASKPRRPRHHRGRGGKGRKSGTPGEAKAPVGSSAKEEGAHRAPDRTEKANGRRAPERNAQNERKDGGKDGDKPAGGQNAPAKESGGERPRYAPLPSNDVKHARHRGPGKPTGGSSAPKK